MFSRQALIGGTSGLFFKAGLIKQMDADRVSVPRKYNCVRCLIHWIESKFDKIHEYLNTKSSCFYAQPAL